MIPGIFAGQMRAPAALGGAHVYWRIWITAVQTAGNAFATLTEIEMRAEAGGPDQCSGGTALASGQQSSFSPSQAFDNIYSGFNFWISQSASGGPRWVGYQFASAVPVKQVALVAENGDANAHNGDLKDFEVQYSDDGAAWTTIASFAGEPAWANNELRLYTVP